MENEGFIDFNGDNAVDILADNMSTREKATWMISSSNVLTTSVFASKPSWRMCGTGQFGGDSTTDIVAENVSTGQKSIWIMSYSNNSFSIESEKNFATNLSTRIVGVGDFNGDNNADLVCETLTSSSDPFAQMSRKVWFYEWNY